MIGGNADRPNGLLLFAHVRLARAVGRGQHPVHDHGDPARRRRALSQFAAFYPFYLTEHVHPVSRRLHVIGTTLVVVCLALGALRDWRFFLAAPLIGYGFAWIGHFVFEKNRPATFKYPLYSLMGDFRLWFETVTGRRRW